MGLFLQPGPQLSRNTSLILLSDLKATGSCWMEKMFSGLSSVVRTESFTSMEASYSTEVKTTSTETRIKSRPTPDRDEMKTLRGWDQVKTKNSTNYRHSSNRSEIYPTSQKETPAEDQFNNTPFHCFNFQPTTFLFVWDRPRLSNSAVESETRRRQSIGHYERQSISVTSSSPAACLQETTTPEQKALNLKYRAKILSWSSFYSPACSHTTVKIHTANSCC